MTVMLSFFVEGTPVAQPRQRHTKTGRNYIPRDHPIHAFKQLVAARAIEARAIGGTAPMKGPIDLHMTFVLPRPKSMIWRRKAMERTFAPVRPDFDNLAKGATDALKGIAWLDDAQVCQFTCDKVYANGDELPGVYIQIEELP